MDKIYGGSTLKMAINFSYPADPSVSLTSISWQTEWYTSEGLTTLVIPNNGHRAESVTEQGVTRVQYYAYVPTENLGKGELYFRLKCQIPDAFLTDGYRTDISEGTTNVVIE